MRPFDLEAAKRGEPIVFIVTATQEAVHCRFLGATERGNIAVDTDIYAGSYLREIPPHHLRMAPRKVVKYVVLKPREIAAGVIFTDTWMHETPPIPACADSVVARVEWEE